MSFKGVDLLSVISWPRYYWLLLKAAFTRGWSIFGAANLVAAFTAWALAKRFPRWEAVLNDLAWQIPAVLGLGTIAIRWIVAPFEVHRKTVKQADKRISGSLDQVYGLNSQINKLTKTQPVQPPIKARITALTYKLDSDEHGCRRYVFDVEIVNREDSPLIVEPTFSILTNQGERSGPYKIFIKNFPEQLKTISVDGKKHAFGSIAAVELFNPIPDQFQTMVSYPSNTDKQLALQLKFTDVLTKRTLTMTERDAYDVS